MLEIVVGGLSVLAGMLPLYVARMHEAVVLPVDLLGETGMDPVDDAVVAEAGDRVVAVTVGRSISIRDLMLSRRAVGGVAGAGVQAGPAARAAKGSVLGGARSIRLLPRSAGGRYYLGW